ncbi:MAG: hypothetical protein KAJ32_10430, partial [Gammaproteobacteria bacterium]|nr:hypothetical protein [Gammaproteobacteria bacterium]
FLVLKIRQRLSDHWRFLCPRMDGIPQGARKAMRLCPWMDGQIFTPGNICTSTIHGGRIPQRARMAVRLCLGYLYTERCYTR